MFDVVLGIQLSLRKDFSHILILDVLSEAIKAEGRLKCSGKDWGRRGTNEPSGISELPHVYVLGLKLMTWAYLEIGRRGHSCNILP